MLNLHYLAVYDRQFYTKSTRKVHNNNDILLLIMYTVEILYRFLSEQGYSFFFFISGVSLSVAHVDLYMGIIISESRA